MKDGTPITLDKKQLTHTATIITVASRVEGTNLDASFQLGSIGQFPEFRFEDLPVLQKA